MRRTTYGLAAAVSAALLLAGCGGDQGKKDDEIAGADGGKPSASPSPASSEAAPVDDERPKMDFPKDFEIVTDWQKPSDKKEAAALNDAMNFVRGIRHGIVEQDADSASYKFYSVALSSAQKYAKQQVQGHIDGGWTLTGTDRYTQPNVQLAENAKRALVSFCHDQSKMYGKELKTDKVLKTEPSAKSFSRYEVVMEPVSKSELWQAQAIEVKSEAKQCAS